MKLFFLIYHYVNLKRIRTLKIFLSYNKALFACITRPVALNFSIWLETIVERFHGRSELVLFFVCLFVLGFFWILFILFGFLVFFLQRSFKIPILKFNYRPTATYLFISLAVAESWIGTTSILGSIFMQLPSWNQPVHFFLIQCKRCLFYAVNLHNIT